MNIPYPLLPEQRDEVLETLKSRLEKALIDQQTTATTNKELEKECVELQALVKEYEAGLESVATKLRSHAVKYLVCVCLEKEDTIILKKGLYYYRMRLQKGKFDFDVNMKHY